MIFTRESVLPGNDITVMSNTSFLQRKARARRRWRSRAAGRRHHGGRGSHGARSQAARKAELIGGSAAVVESEEAGARSVGGPAAPLVGSEPTEGDGLDGRGRPRSRPGRR